MKVHIQAESGASSSIARLRGEFLETTWRIDRRIARLLAQILAKDKTSRDVLLSVILGHQEMTFSVKAQMLADVVKVIPIPEVNKHLIKGISKIRQFRNDMAHSIFSTKSTDDQIQMITLKKGKVVTIPLKVERLKEMLAQAKLTRVLLEVAIRVHSGKVESIGPEHPLHPSNVKRD